MAMTAELAYQKVCSMIYRGQLRPGDRLVESKLAAQLGISHIPVRESLCRLQNEGLVRSVPNWATFVENFSPADVLEIYAMRLLLEPMATRLATVRAGQPLVKQLKRLYDKMTMYRESGDDQKLDEADYQFHLAIVRASKFKRLIRAYESCHILVLSCHGYEEMRQSITKASSNEHQRIMELILNNRPDAAERAAYNHVQKAMQRVETVIDARIDDPPLKFM